MYKSVYIYSKIYTCSKIQLDKKINNLYSKWYNMLALTNKVTLQLCVFLDLITFGK